MHRVVLSLLFVSSLAGCTGDGGTDTTPTHTGTTDTTDTSPPAGEVLTDNGDGTSTGSVSGLTWTTEGSTEALLWADAVTWCDTLAVAGGGWHLPTITELRTLIRGCEGTVTDGTCGASDTCTDTTCRDGTCYACDPDQGPTGGCYGPAELTQECEAFWASTEVGNDPGSAWFVSFNDGHVYSYGVGNHYFARCVRP